MKVNVALVRQGYGRGFGGAQAKSLMVLASAYLSLLQPNLNFKDAIAIMSKANVKLGRKLRIDDLGKLRAESFLTIAVAQLATKIKEKQSLPIETAVQKAMDLVMEAYRGTVDLV